MHGRDEQVATRMNGKATINGDRTELVPLDSASPPPTATQSTSGSTTIESGKSRFRLVYFDIKGRAENARMVLALAGEPYDDVRLSPEEWLTFKSTTPFGQLPILEVDGETVLCQSRAIERYLARELGFFGETNVESAQIDMILECINDAMVNICQAMPEQDSEKKARLLSDYKSSSACNGLKNFRRFLTDKLKGQWFMGTKITLADVCVYNALHYILSLIPDALDDCDVLLEWRCRFEEHPSIADWLKRRPPGKY